MVELFSSDAVKIICLLVGVAFIGIETLIPGFGIAGFMGVVMLLVGTACMWIQHGALAGLLVLLGSMVLISIEAIIAIRSASKGRLSKSELILNSEMETPKAVENVSAGDKGKAVTSLNPVGFAEINGKRMEVLCESGFMANGTALTVERIEGKKIIVSKA